MGELAIHRVHRCVPHGIAKVQLQDLHGVPRRTFGKPRPANSRWRSSGVRRGRVARRSAIVDFERWMEMSIEYIDAWLLPLDMKIFPKTGPSCC